MFGAKIPPRTSLGRDDTFLVVRWSIEGVGTPLLRCTDDVPIWLALTTDFVATGDVENSVAKSLCL